MRQSEILNWFVLLSQAHYLLALVSLVIIKRLFDNIKYNWLFVSINFFTSSILALTNVLILVYEHEAEIKGIFEAFLGVLPLIIVINAMNNMNESHKVYQI